ncbi:MAG: hypothetical protein AB7T86_09200 [Xanthobacteraceae bacterium]
MIRIDILLPVFLPASSRMPSNDAGASDMRRRRVGIATHAVRTARQKQNVCVAPGTKHIQFPAGPRPAALQYKQVF